MTEPNKIVILYSKYSPKCKDILNSFDPSNGKVQLVCIDNIKVRNKIIKSSIDIQSVPCVIMLYDNGQYDKFEGDNVYDWIIEQFTIQPQQFEDNIERYDDQVANTQVEQTDINSLIDDDDEEDDEPEFTSIATNREKSAQELAKELSKERESLLPQNPRQMQ